MSNCVLCEYGIASFTGAQCFRCYRVDLQDDLQVLNRLDEWMPQLDDLLAAAESPRDLHRIRQFLLDVRLWMTVATRAQVLALVRATTFRQFAQTQLQLNQSSTISYARTSTAATSSGSDGQGHQYHDHSVEVMVPLYDLAIAEVRVAGGCRKSRARTTAWRFTATCTPRSTG